MQTELEILIEQQEQPRKRKVASNWYLLFPELDKKFGFSERDRKERQRR